MRIGKIGVVVIGLVPFNVIGECTPAPDCASIGYTETSCEGDYLACPFDSTKLKCTPCDSSFRYDCSGDNITGGTGSACGGKYVSCECSSSDYIFANGSCICDTSCKVGAIYYSDGSCSACVDNTKTAIGVVVKDNEIVMSNITKNVQWGGFGTDIETLANITTTDDAKEDYAGKENTAKIVAHFGEDVDATLYAGIFCYKYSIDGTNAQDWYLPAGGELYNYVFVNKSKILDTFTNKLAWDFSGDLWGSFEFSNARAWYMGVGGYVGHHDKRWSLNVACFLEI